VPLEGVPEGLGRPKTQKEMMLIGNKRGGRGIKSLNLRVKSKKIIGGMKN
jgi:hypothetical protein